MTDTTFETEAENIISRDDGSILERIQCYKLRKGGAASMEGCAEALIATYNKDDLRWLTFPRTMAAAKCT